MIIRYTTDINGVTTVSADGATEAQVAVELARREAAIGQPIPLTWKQSLTADWKALPLAVRAAFAPIRAAVFVAIDDDDFELAYHLIQEAVVPAELEPVRQALLAGIPWP